MSSRPWQWVSPLEQGELVGITQLSSPESDGADLLAMVYPILEDRDLHAEARSTKVDILHLTETLPGSKVGQSGRWSNRVESEDVDSSP